MRKVAIVLVVLVLALGGLLAARLRMQDRALRGATGGAGEIEGTEVDLSSRISARVARLYVKKARLSRRATCWSAWTARIRERLSPRPRNA